MTESPDSPQQRNPDPQHPRGTSMSVALALGLGFFVLTAVASVLAVGLISGYQSTIRLLEQKADLIVSAEVTQVRTYLDASRDQVDFLVRRVEQGDVTAGMNEEFIAFMTGALAATPQIVGIQYLGPGDRMVGVVREEDSTSLRLGSLSGDADLRQQIDMVRSKGESNWGGLLWRESHAQVTLTYHAPVALQDGARGVVSVFIAVRRLSEAISDLESEFGANAFILYGRDLVLAHPLLAFGYDGLTRLTPLPRQDIYNDPILSSIWHEQEKNFLEQQLVKSPGVRFVRFGSDSYMVLFREVNGYADRPLLVGTHLPSVDILSEVERLSVALVLCLIISVLSAVTAGYIGHRIAQPVRRLSAGAAKVHQLDLASVEPIEGSVFRELNEAANSFNAMLCGLRWFERYVPKALVQRLIKLDDDAAVASNHRMVTLMFTDICGFTHTTETMTAPETVEMINHHFTLLAEHIEKEGGSIDRFEGDGLLAIFGALEPYEDMADRACRAANAIRRALIEDNKRQAQVGGPQLRMRIGMHTGRVVVGNLGSPGRVSYSVAGDAVVVTRRIEEIAKTLGRPQDTVNILASASVRSALARTLPMTRHGPQVLRGRSEQVEIYTLDPDASDSEDK